MSFFIIQTGSGIIRQNNYLEVQSINVHFFYSNWVQYILQHYLVKQMVHLPSEVFQQKSTVRLSNHPFQKQACKLAACSAKFQYQPSQYDLACLYSFGSKFMSKYD
ncbi:hypothetical protein BpHYR1_025958 [Brachionus plicatilis]|uniref:Uncharacterized protein n=1 Tax=Brachionus plicatilis TaxID=10195 RepID=A0A3M7SMA4_BRAPC|nr:hypothetical protein BpHYR1_025958 [Brachionus plicatilis]